MSNLIVKNISKKFDDKIILENFNLEIEDKKFTVLLGASGCGKSTLLKIISGIELQDSGEVFIDNEEISNLSINKRNIVMVFQDHLLFPHLTVFENISFGLKMRKLPKQAIKEKVNKLLDLVKLPEHKNHYPNELSGGQKQRVVLARALAIEPKLLLLDEPFSSLDPELRVEMRNLLKNIQKETKTTMLMVTHDKDEAFLLGDKVAIIFEKKIEQIDTPENIYLNPLSKKVANFFGKVSYLEGVIKNSVFEGCGFKLPLNEVNCFLPNYKNLNMMENISVELLLRPENITPINSNENIIDQSILCKIIKKEFYGDRIFYQLQILNFKNFHLFMTSSSTEDFKVDKEIIVKIKPHKFMIFEKS